MIFQHNFKRLAFYMACNRTEQGKTYFLIVFFLGNANCGAATFLLMSSLRIKIQPDKVAFFSNNFNLAAAFYIVVFCPKSRDS